MEQERSPEEQERPSEEEQPAPAGPPTGEGPPVEPPGPPAAAEVTPPSEPQPAPAEPPTGEGPPVEPPGPPVAAEGAPSLEPKPTPPPPPGLTGAARQNLTIAAITAGVILFATMMFLAGFVVGAFLVDDEESLVVVPASPTGAQTEGGGDTEAGEAFPQVAPPDVDDDPAKGPEDAAVVIIEFSDFQCPFCGRFFRDTLPLIMQNYGEEIRFVYRDFPLTSIHPYAQKAAEAAQCAFEQDAFWEYHDLLFTNQDALDDASLKGYAEELDLDAEDFADCLDAGRYREEVQQDYNDGLAAGVDGTPTFFINGQRVGGAQPYPVFQAAIDAALAEAAQ